MSDNASVVLSNDKAKSSICIKGYVNMELLNQIGVKEQKFDCYINGEKIFTEKVNESGTVTFVLNKNNINDDYLILEIKTSACVNLSKLGSGADQRNLSWILGTIEQQ